jgi:hypothetical protein
MAHALVARLNFLTAEIDLNDRLLAAIERAAELKRQITPEWMRDATSVREMRIKLTQDKARADAELARTDIEQSRRKVERYADELRATNRVRGEEINTNLGRIRRETNAETKQNLQDEQTRLVNAKIQESQRIETLLNAARMEVAKHILLSDSSSEAAERIAILDNPTVRAEFVRTQWAWQEAETRVQDIRDQITRLSTQPL